MKLIGDPPPPPSPLPLYPPEQPGQNGRRSIWQPPKTNIQCIWFSGVNTTSIHPSIHVQCVHSLSINQSRTQNNNSAKKLFEDMAHWSKLLGMDSASWDRFLCRLVTEFVLKESYLDKRQSSLFYSRVECGIFF